MTYLLTVLALLSGLGFIWLVVSGIRIHRKLLRLKKAIGKNSPGVDIKTHIERYTNAVFNSMALAEKHAKNNSTGTSTSVPDPGSLTNTYGVKSQFFKCLTKFIRQFNNDYNTNIKLGIVDGNSHILYKDSITLLRIVLQLAEKCLINKIELMNIFILAIDPMQLSIEVTRPTSYDHCDVYSIAHAEITRSTSIQIIHYEKDGFHERLVLGANRDDKDNSSRRPRDFQGKY